jgi:hypothetical protein
VKFPTGGIVRERKLNRFDSGTDSIVWMKEANFVMCTPEEGVFLWEKMDDY